MLTFPSCRKCRLHLGSSRPCDSPRHASCQKYWQSPWLTEWLLIRLWLRWCINVQALLDVYTYTAVISICIYNQDVEKALNLAREMRSKGIERNVHTYTALMNVCIKCGRCPLALETYHHMRQDGCQPNVVTFNTLIDVHGKMGQWESAIKVLNIMKNEVGLLPVRAATPALQLSPTLLRGTCACSCKRWCWNLA